MNYSQRYQNVKKALENEMSVDDFSISYYKINAKGICYFKIPRFKDKLPLFLSFFCVFVIPFYFLYQLIISFKAEAQNQIPESDHIFLSFSVSPKIKKIYYDYASELSFVQCVTGRKLLFIRKLALTKILACFIKSIGYALRFILSVSPRYFLHATSIFELVLFCAYLDELQAKGIKTVTLTNHYDRWVTLTSCRSGVDINIIQHGVVSSDYYPENKLKNVITVRGFSDEQLDVFKKNIVDNGGFQRLYLKVNISVNQGDKCTLLIISNPFYIDSELDFYKKLTSQNVDVKFRPHPLFPDKRLSETIRPEDLCIAERYPAPQYCLCRGSTLGHEYEAMGYKIIAWDDKTDFESIQAMISQ